MVKGELKYTIVGKTKMEVKLIKFKMFECLEKLKDELKLKEDDSIIRKYIKSVSK